jgi:Mg/Co/Ni transporter MgtE
MPIQVTSDVLDGLKAVRDSGTTNMFDRPRVIEILEEMGFDQAAVWVNEHKEEYSRGIFQGFEAR